MPHNVPPMGVPPPPTGETTNLPNLPMLRQSFGVGPPLPPMQLSQSDDMDVEMEDVMPQQQNSINIQIKDKPNLSDQLLAVMVKGNSIIENERDMRERERRDRDRGGDNQREQRGRGRDRGRDRRRSERDDVRRDDRRDRDILRQHDGQLSMAGLLQDTDINIIKKDKLCLTERLRQLSESKLINDERIDGRICERGDRSIERTSLQFDDTHSSVRPPSLMDLPKFTVPSERDFSQQRGPDYGRQPQDIRDFSRNERDRVFVQRGGGGGVGPGPGPGPGRGPIDDFTDPRILGPRFTDEFDRLGPNGPRPDEFDLRLHPREEFDRPEMRRHPMDDYEAERIEFEMRQREREGFDPRLTDGFDPRLHPDHPDFDPRRREFFGLMEPGPPGFGPMMGNRGGPRGPMVPDAFARGHGKFINLLFLFSFFLFKKK